MCENADVLNLFHTNNFVKVCAPMVRYSKLQFRNLVRKYNCDLCFTPMILADSFCKSEKARNNEFTTSLGDTPLITQFAANMVHDFVGAAYLCSPYCSGVDLNCGCPQTWAKQQELGCAMLHKPELIYDIVRQCRNQINKPFTISVKMRILKDLRKNVEICRQIEKAGVTFITVHGRTSDQLTGDINTEALKLVVESVNVPIIANGGIKTLEDCNELQEETKCKGVMVANGILTNPTIFSGSNITTEECVQNWLNICYNSTLTYDNYSEVLTSKNRIKPTIREKPFNLTFQCFHHHLVFMLEKLLIRKQRQIFNNLKKFQDVLDFIEEDFSIVPKLFTPNEFEYYNLKNLDYPEDNVVYNKFKPTDIISNDFNISYEYCSDNDGKYFQNKLVNSDEDQSDCDWSGMFIEND